MPHFDPQPVTRPAHLKDTPVALKAAAVAIVAIGISRVMLPVPHDEAEIKQHPIIVWVQECGIAEIDRRHLLSWMFSEVSVGIVPGIARPPLFE